MPLAAVTHQALLVRAQREVGMPSAVFDLVLFKVYDPHAFPPRIVHLHVGRVPPAQRRHRKVEVCEHAPLGVVEGLEGVHCGLLQQGLLEGRLQGVHVSPVHAILARSHPDAAVTGGTYEDTARVAVTVRDRRVASIQVTPVTNWNRETNMELVVQKLTQLL